MFFGLFVIIYVHMHVEAVHPGNAAAELGREHVKIARLVDDCVLEKHLLRVHAVEGFASTH